MPLIDPIRAEFKREMATCRRVLERVSEDRFSWKPHPRSFSLRELSCHLVNLVGWTETLLTRDGFTITPDFKAWETDTWVDLMERFDHNVARALELMDDLSDQALKVEWTLKSGDHEMMRARRIDALRYFILNHSIHHRGQLSVYLRLNDLPVPSIYGPSADEKPPGRG